jgi:hypothetical protein
MDCSFPWCRQYGAKIYELVDKRIYQSFLLLLQCITWTVDRQCSPVFENMKQNTVCTVFLNFVNFRNYPLMSRICTFDDFVINAFIDYL